MRKILFILSSLLFLTLSPAFAQKQAKPPIKIGEMFCYTGCPDVAASWRNGWQMALDEINKEGGVLGRPLAVVSRDDKGSPSETVKNLEELKDRNKAQIVFGTLYDHTSMAASNYAKRNKMLLMKGFGGSENLIGAEGHNLYFQFEPPVTTWARLTEKAAASGKKRWAIMAVDYELGRAAVKRFRDDLKRLNPEVEFVEMQWFPFGKLNAGPVVQALAHAKPDAIYALVMQADYLRFVREGRKRKLFDNRLVVGPLSGYPGYIEPLGKEAPEGWLTASGYPIQDIAEPAHKDFVKRYTALYKQEPSLAALYAYCTLKILAESVNKAGSDDALAVANVMHQTTFNLPVGEIRFRMDGASNMGAWVGVTGFKNGKPTILNPEYVTPDKYLLPVEENLKLREGK